MWSLTSPRVERISGPEKCVSSAKRDFFNTIGHQLTWRRDHGMSVLPSEAEIVSESSLFVKCHQMTSGFASHLIADTKKQIRT